MFGRGFISCAGALSCVFAVSVSLAYTPKSVFFKAPANVNCAWSTSNTNFSVTVVHTGTLSQAQINSGSVKVRVVDSDDFADDPLDKASEDITGRTPGPYRFTTKHDLWCTKKTECDVAGPSGSSGESEGELRVEYDDSSDNYGAATVLCVDPPETILRPGPQIIIAALFETAPNPIRVTPGGTLSVSIRLNAGSNPLPAGIVIHSQLEHRSTGVVAEVPDLLDQVLPAFAARETGAGCIFPTLPADLPTGDYVLRVNLVLPNGTIVEGDVVDVFVDAPVVANKP